MNLEPRPDFNLNEAAQPFCFRSQALGDILAYAERRDWLPMAGSSRRWPEDPNMACIWDCGNGWEGYDEPMHAGLDDETRDEFVRALQDWNASCYAEAESGKACLKRQNATSIRSAVEKAKRTEFMQEVCGEYIDESAKFLIENPGIAALAVIGAVVFPGAGTAAAATAIGIATVSVGKSFFHA